MEIATNHGGPGTDVGLSSDDDSKTVDLPFAFTYYGETFTRATICTNGWIAMGSTWLTNYRNWNIPAAGAPPYMIAPMWDNLYESGQDAVYHWYDSANHRYIVQWSRVRNDYGGTTQNFEVILYDPEHHTTGTGDGIIEFQFDAFNNSDWEQHYSTTGIENEDRTDGLMYGYFNYYNTGAASISSGRAIRFITLSCDPHGTLTGTITNETNGGTPIENATITVVEIGQTISSGPDGVYTGGVQPGLYHVAASHASFAPVTTWPVIIAEDETTIVDFSLVDIMPPIFSGTTDYGNTTDTAGPYDITSTVIEYSNFEELAVVYNVCGAGWVTVAMEDQGESVYKASIPGQSYTSLVHYYLTGQDVGGNASTDPQNPPEEVYAFWVMPPLFSDDMEAGTGTWSHYVVTGGYEDQWHRSSEKNHTPDGSWSWKLGDTGGGTYADMSDGALVSESFAIEGNTTLSFWHWIDAEVSGSYPGYAYDGGLVEISVEGGPWTEITPVSGYPYRVREGSGPGPFPSETPFYSGTSDWTEARFDLGGFSGNAQVRFRFGSDGAVNQDGWYIDDVQIIAENPGAAGVRELELLPDRVALYQNVPNPFGPRDQGTQIRFDLPQACPVRLKVFDTSGRLVRTLIDTGLPGGQHRVQWDGRDVGHRRLGSGVYFYILEVNAETRTKRLLVVR